MTLFSVCLTFFKENAIRIKGIFERSKYEHGFVEWNTSTFRSVRSYQALRSPHALHTFKKCERTDAEK